MGSTMVVLTNFATIPYLQECRKNNSFFDITMPGIDEFLSIICKCQTIVKLVKSTTELCTGGKKTVYKDFIIKIARVSSGEDFYF